MISKIVVAGAGTMGSGIAMTCALNGFEVILYDPFENAIQKGAGYIEDSLNIFVSKNKLTSTEKEEVQRRIVYTSQINDCKADLVIEAIVESAPVKIELFNKLNAINKSDSIFVSNTSSLSISGIQKEVPNPGRVAGLHFFNPAHLMKLVEVIKGEGTSQQVIETLVQFCTDLKKTSVVCKDAPGFIVNRVARHYYLEAFRIVENELADFETIDAVMESTGFKMGPFRLMDMIGMDINLAVSRSLFHAFEEERFRPSVIQEKKVEQGDLGRKTGKGFYNY